jgi:hypothetical protein
MVTGMATTLKFYEKYSDVLWYFLFIVNLALILYDVITVLSDLTVAIARENL